jgi:hypothetical protein
VRSKLIVLLLCGAHLAQAASLPAAVKGVVVTTPGQPTPEAHAFATRKDKLLLADYLEAIRPGADHDRMLRTKLEHAQRSWLSGDIEAARADFRALTELALKADWKNDQREAIQAAFLRMAQSSESGTERENWLESAARLYGDIAPEASLFPPPLMNQYDAIKTRMTTVSLDLADVFPDFRYVLIDGRKVDLALDSHVSLSGGLHRLTALSDSHESVTEFMTAAQLRVLRLSPPPLIEGVCESARLRSHGALASGVDVEIYSGPACTPKIASVLDGARLVTAARASNGPPGPPLTTLPSDATSEPATKSRTWIYVVGGALLAGAAYALTHQQGPSGPTHRSGFGK